MSFRARLLLAFLPLALAPLAFFGMRARVGVTARLTEQDARRVAAVADVIEQDLARESAAAAARLDRLADAIAADNRFRRALLEVEGAERAYVLDYAGQAMRLAGLDLLRIQDEEGRVLSSGHFRNEYDAVDPRLPAALARADGGAVLVVVPTPSGRMLALARARSVRVGARTLALVGGTAVNGGFLERLGRGTDLSVRLLVGDSALATAAPGDDAGAARTGPTREVRLRLAGDGPDTVARLVVRASTAPLEALRRGLDRWLLGVSAGAVALALLLALLVSRRVSRPLMELAETAERVDLDRPDAVFATGRRDEIGALARVLDEMTRRLRAGAARLREAERRATIGEIARQVNHDVRNGLIPIRNVVSHLAGLARERPGDLRAVFLERQGTLEAGVDYLHSLATNYARLSPRLESRPCDLNRIALDVVRDAGRPAGGSGAGMGAEPGVEDRAAAESPAAARVVIDLAPGLPRVHAEPVALRRILENLVVNALESMEDFAGTVTVSTRLERGDGAPRVLLAVADTGRGMSAEERARLFDHFYTTKPDGTGLGLAIVRRLVTDLGGRIAVESEPGRGSRFTIELPPADEPAGADRQEART